MARRKLTLSVDETVIESAHEYSAAHGTSISQLVTDFLAGLGAGGERREYAPTVRRLIGVLPPDVDVEEYRRHLDAKYGR